jgi:hypothetical protein
MWVGSQRQAPAALPLAKRPGTHFTGSSVDPRAGLGGCGKSRPLPEWSLDLSRRSESLHLQSDVTYAGLVLFTSTQQMLNLVKW